MGNGKAENLTVGEITFGNSNVLPDVIERLLRTLVEKNIISNDEADEIIAESINDQVEKFGENIDQVNYVTEFKDSREILLSQAGSLKDDEHFDELLEFIYKERGRSMTE